MLETICLIAFPVIGLTGITIAFIYHLRWKREIHERREVERQLGVYSEAMYKMNEPPRIQSTVIPDVSALSGTVITGQSSAQKAE